MDKGFVGGEEAVSAGQQIAFEHALHRVLAEHLDDAAIGRQLAAVLVFREVLLDPEFLGDLVDGLQLVRGGFVRSEDAEVVHVLLHHVAQEDAQRRDILGLDGSRLVDLDRVIAEVRQAQSTFSGLRHWREDWRSCGGSRWARVP